jgi:hypothetical protein
MASGFCRTSEESEITAQRQLAPIAHFIVSLIYSRLSAPSGFGLCLAAAAPFVGAALLAPALLSFVPTVELLAPIAQARAILAGAAPLASDSSTLYLAVLALADLFFDSPGKVHLAAKALAALLISAPLAYFASARFPAAASIIITAAAAAIVTAPLSGSADLSMALLSVLAIAFVAAPVDDGPVRASIEGVLAGVILVILWLSSPVLSLLGVLALSACPFLTGRSALVRYGVALLTCLALIGVTELLAPGTTQARALTASSLVAQFNIGACAAILGKHSSVAAAAAIILVAAAVFGGLSCAKSWAGASALLLAAVAFAPLSDAEPTMLFVLAALIAVFSLASPFSADKVRAHDQASLALTCALAALALFWGGHSIAQSAGQFILQQKTASLTPEYISQELGLIQPGGPMISRWVEEGRFSTPEARDLFALSPMDQTVMLLDGAKRARALSAGGFDVAILTGADTACIIANRRACSADGRAAAERAKVVLVPRLDLGGATTAIKDRSEALLYTEFKMAEVTPLWEIWVRRGVSLPAAN